MLNEPMDDDATEEDLDIMMAQGVPAEVVTTKDPDNTFRRDLAGRSVLFRIPAPGQALIVRRVWAKTIKDIKAVRDDKKTADDIRYERILAISEDFDLKMLTFVEGLIVNPDDVDFLVEAQLLGVVSVSDLFGAVMSLGRDPQPDDDAAPPKAAKKAVKKANPNPIRKAATAKKAANARRTQK
jgi:hypothetical protein